MVLPAVRVKELRRTYGFEEVAIVPGDVTTNPELSVTQLAIGPYRFSIPIVASAMDAIVNPAFAGLMAKAGGLGVMNLEGLYCRYDDPSDALNAISSAPREEATDVMQRVYTAEFREDLVGRRVREIKDTGAIAAVSITPARTKRLAPIAVEAGADIIVVQSTVTTARHIS
ncbi:MAG: IMP dehydrogenase, partial [Chloroflexi bacterium]|nr:IMP dehydrogenase [Chloroflexota bacterium]